MQHSKHVFVGMSSSILGSAHKRLLRIKKGDHSIDDVTRDKGQAKELAQTVWDLINDMGK